MQKNLQLLKNSNNSNGIPKIVGSTCEANHQIAQKVKSDGVKS